MSDQVGLPVRPRIPKHFNIVPMSDGRIQMKSAHKTVVLGGKSIKAVGKLLGLLDGTRTIEVIVNEFPEVPEEEVLTTLRRLTDRGLVEEAGSSPGELQSGLYDAQMTLFGITSRMAVGETQAALRKSYVTVFGLGRVGSCAIESLARSGVGNITGVDPEIVDNSLISSGGFYQMEDIGDSRGDAMSRRIKALNPDVKFQAVQVTLDDPQGVANAVHRSSLALVCQDAPAVAVYRAVNEASLKCRVPWLKAAVDGFEGQLGPTVVPGESACYTCYELRTKANWTYYEENSAFEDYLTKEHPKVDYGGLAAISGIVGNLAALEAIKLLTGFMPPVTCGRFYTLNINSLELQSHQVMKLPRCPSCSVTLSRPKPTLWSLQGG